MDVITTNYSNSVYFNTLSGQNFSGINTMSDVYTGSLTTSTASSGMNAASAWNLGGAVFSTALQIGSSLISSHYSKKIANAQARIAKAQAQIQANQYAAEGVGYEMTARRIQEAYGQQEYETIRQQESYMQDMELDAAVRGGAMEGTNSYMIAQQAKEFERSNAYASLQNDREQANYMLAANQSYLNAQSALTGGTITAASIKSQASYNNAANYMNLGSGLLNTWSNYAWRNYQING